MPRAYSPRLSTAHLATQIRALDGVARVTIIPPRRRSPARPTMLRVALVPQGMNPEPAHTDFTIPEARAWLAAEKGTNDE